MSNIQFLILNISEINGCIIIPTYNNEKTLERVLNGVLDLVPSNRVIVINDGATDSTAAILSNFTSLHILVNEPNRGKGYSLRKGLKKAIELGFENAITIDSDGQHFPNDIPLMIQSALENPGTVLMGSRNMQQEGVPQKSSFGNKFSNFWFKAETWITLPDTQTGFRLYPLQPLKKMRLFTNKFELEIEIIVRLAWKKVPFKPVMVQVKYDPEERVSHFRPGRDFFRISVLNSILVVGALLYYYPKKFLSLETLRLVKHEAIKPDESNFSKALSLGFGVFMGIIPLWGFQLLIGIPLAVLFRMNKVLFITAANISVPPMIPLVIYASFLVGQQFIDGAINSTKIFEFSTASIGENLQQYIIGAILLAIMAFFTVFTISWALLKLLRKDPKNN